MLGLLCNWKQLDKQQWNVFFCSYLYSCCCYSVAQSCPTLCDPMDCQASLSFTISWSLPRFMTTESMMPSNHLIICCPLLLLTSVFPRIMVFSSKWALSKWPRFGASASTPVFPMNIQDLCPLGLIGLISKGLSRVFSNTIVQKHQFFGTQLSL